MNSTHPRIVNLSLPADIIEQRMAASIAESNLAKKKRRSDRITTIVLIVTVAICAIGGTWIISILS